MSNLNTKAIKTWCPGCGNYALELSFKNAISELQKDKLLKLSDIVILTGIGCHGKMADYLDLNSFYSLHGRTLPVATGIKIANSNLIPIAFSGDGDCYGEGLAHLIFSAKRNSNITVLVHDNRVYGLTTGQFTPVSEKGYEGKSTPHGSVEEPFNPLDLMLASNATFIARGYVGKPEHLKNLIKQAIQHQGFGFVEILQPCVAFHNDYEELNKRVYEMKNVDVKKIREWDYRDGGKIPIGVFQQKDAPIFEEQL